MLDNKQFDQWSADYDQSVTTSNQANRYPFAGYETVLSYIANQIEPKQSKILDIGVGTGVLTKRLYDLGATISGIDFSAQMLATAQASMPKATFIQWDFNHGLPPQFSSEKFDYIISSYAIHHLTDAQKITFIQVLKKVLQPNGKIIIADVAFETTAALQVCRAEHTQIWDEAELYFTAESITPALEKLGITSKYTQISFCAGILEIS